MAHRTTLFQVVANLLSNAIKFVAPDVQPQVRIWVEEREEGKVGDGEIASGETSSAIADTPHKWVRLSVEDNGIGIAPEHQERIFRVFERLHGTETYAGTGIGLAIVRKGMERLGGRAGLESQPNQGSRFWIELPKASG
jgi:signal transduction histidine kinase